MNLKVWSLGLGVWVALGAAALAETPCPCDCNCPCKCTCCQAEQNLSQDNISCKSFTAKDFVLTKRRGSEWCCHVAVPQLTVDPKIASVYPGLAKGVQIFNNRGRFEAYAFLDKFSEVLADIPREKQSADKKAWPGERFRYYESTTDAVRLDSKAVSFLEYFNIYTGGPHGEYGILGYTFDPVTGNAITLDDLIADKNALRQYVNERLQKEYPKAAFFGREETLHKLFNVAQDSEVDSTLIEHHWVMTDTGIIFHFNPYEVASFADGLLTVEVDANACLELFRPEARQRYFKTGRTGEEKVSPQYLRPAELGQMVGKWHLVSGEIEGSKSSAKELGIDCQIEVNDEGLAHLVLKQNDTISRQRDMSVRIVSTPLYDGCPQDKWSAYLFDADSERELQATVLPDGTMRVLIFTYVENQEHPRVFCGDFKRE